MKRDSGEKVKKVKRVTLKIRVWDGTKYLRRLTIKNLEIEEFTELKTRSSTPGRDVPIEEITVEDGNTIVLTILGGRIAVI